MEQAVREYQEGINLALHKRMNSVLDEVYEDLGLWIQQYLEQADRMVENIPTSDHHRSAVYLLTEYMEFCRQNLDLLDELLLIVPVARKEQLAYDEVLDKFLREHSKQHSVAQSDERFNTLVGDAFFVRCIKAGKRIGFSLYALPAKTCRLINKLAKKELFKKASQIKPWRQNIPLSKLSYRYYSHELFKEYSAIFVDLHKQVALSCTEIRGWDELMYPAIAGSLQENELIDTFRREWQETIRPSLVNLQKEFREGKKQFSLRFSQQSALIRAKFWDQAQLGGTLEFKAFKHWIWRNKRLASRQRKLFMKKNTHRRNTIFAICDDWKFSQEMYLLSCNALKCRLLLGQQMKDKQVSLQTLMQPMSDFLNHSLAKIPKEDAVQAKKILQQLKYDTGKELVNNIITPLVEYLDRMELLSLIDQHSDAILQDLNKMTSKRILIAHFDPSKAYSSHALKSVSPYRLIQFEIARAWSHRMHLLKLSAKKDLADVSAQLKNLGRINLVNLESAIVRLETQKQSEAKLACQDAHSGVERALVQLQTLTSYCDAIYQQLNTGLEEAIQQYVLALLNLTVNENAEAIRIRILKADFKKNFLLGYTHLNNFLKQAFKTVLVLSGVAKKKTGEGIGQLKTKLGLQELAQDITTEVSELLSFDYEDIQQLPFVYQRLFSNEPLKDESFYLGRNQENSVLLKAYQKWTEGLFTPSLIYGEKGSGVSTLVEMFLPQNNKDSPKLIKVVPENRMHTEQDLLSLLGKAFRKKAFNNLDELYTYIEKQEAFCVFLDKLHLMYLRQPKGFELLKLLFRIISSSNKTVFWICACEKYAADYLNKTLGLFGYFPVLIPMQALDVGKIIEIVLIRHRASGYDLLFLPSSQDLEDKKFSKASDLLQQESLEKKFFATLHQIMQTNISFALLLWLTSIKRIENNTVQLESLDKLDFSFLYTQTNEAVFALHALLLHETMNSEELAGVLNCSERQANLLLMRLNDRGIVLREGRFYKIHTLLYPYTVQMLKDKNLIY